MHRLTFLFLSMVIWLSIAGCQRTPGAGWDQHGEALLIETNYKEVTIFLAGGQQIPLPQREDLRPWEWTPSGKRLVWISEKDDPAALWVSDPCGQEEPRLVVDMSAYPKWRLASAGFHWLDDDTLLLDIRPRAYQPGQPCCYIWRMDVGTQISPSVWKESYSVVRVLSPQVLVLWSEATRANVFWTPQGTFSLPRSWENPFFSPGYLSPDGRWLAWEGDDGIYVGPFDHRQGVLSERKIASSGHLFGWQAEPTYLIVKHHQNIDKQRSRYEFRFLDPSTGQRVRTRVFVEMHDRAGKAGYLHPLSPDGTRVALETWPIRQSKNEPWAAHVVILDLQTGHREVLLTLERGFPTVLDWKRIDLSRCPNPSEIR